MNMTTCNYLTIDVEDYFQVSAFESIVRKDNWDTYPSRVVQNTQKILSILEEEGVKATFFVLGWTAKKHPELVRQIAEMGHEVGCHSYYHRLVYDLTPEEFRTDTYQAKDTLEQILGKPLYGYRAPSYSITRKCFWAIQILRDLGFTYSSSVFPIYHDRYGIPDAPRYRFYWDLSGEKPQIASQTYQQSEPAPRTINTRQLLEYPISTSLFMGRKIPVSGGGYFRLFPYWFTKMALKKINNHERRYFIFYLHPWEFDPEQPRLNTASWFSKFRHYNNLEKTDQRFAALIREFEFGPIYSVD